MSRRPIDRLEDRIRVAIDQRKVLEDKHVRREIMRAVEEYVLAEHDFAIGWTMQAEYKPEERLAR